MCASMIELRSDSFTKPCTTMRLAMAEAEVGDDQYGEDPTVRQLETSACALLHFEAGVFLPSGTQANLVALLSHCERGDEYIAGQESHILKWEGGGGAIFGGIQPQSVPADHSGTIDFNALVSAIKPAGVFFPRTRLLCLEDTFWGNALPLDYLAQFLALAKTRGLLAHLDGARLFNAAVRQGVPPSRIAAEFDSVSVCLSKGLGAPAGSLLLSSEQTIRAARRWRKLLGGAMRQSGVLAAAGLFALRNNIERLAEDHKKAAVLLECLSELPAFEVLHQSLPTNMVLFRLRRGSPEAFVERMATSGVRILHTDPMRLVFHKDVSWEQTSRVVEVMRNIADAG